MTNTKKSGPKRGAGPVAGIDLSQAVLDPASVFRHPEDISTCEELTAAMRRRLLQLWEADVRAQMREEDEGGPVRTTRADVLEEIRGAIVALRGGAHSAGPAGAAER